MVLSLLTEKQKIFWKIAKTVKMYLSWQRNRMYFEKLYFLVENQKVFWQIAKTVSNSKTYLSLQRNRKYFKKTVPNCEKIYLSWQRNRVYFEKLQSMFQTMKHICIHRSWQRNSKYFEKLQKLFQTMTKYIYFDREAESVFKSYKNCFKQKNHCSLHV